MESISKQVKTVLNEMNTPHEDNVKWLKDLRNSEISGSRTIVRSPYELVELAANENVILTDDEVNYFFRVLRHSFVVENSHRILTINQLLEHQEETTDYSDAIEFIKSVLPAWFEIETEGVNIDTINKILHQQDPQELADVIEYLKANDVKNVLSEISIADIEEIIITNIDDAYYQHLDNLNSINEGECCGDFGGAASPMSTPMNVMGIGDPVPAGANGELGSGDRFDNFVFKSKSKKGNKKKASAHIFTKQAANFLPVQK